MNKVTLLRTVLPTLLYKDLDVGRLFRYRRGTDKVYMKTSRGSLLLNTGILYEDTQADSEVIALEAGEQILLEVI